MKLVNDWGIIMKFENKIKNENTSKNSKEFIETIALASILSTSVSCIYGAITVLNYNSYKSNFTYSKNENGEYVAIGTINYKELSKCYFVQIKNDTTNTDEFYVCKKENSQYINILNNKNVFESENNSNKKIINENLVDDYLYGYNEIKSKYTSGDIENLIEKIKYDIKQEDKEFIKVKFSTNNSFC